MPQLHRKARRRQHARPRLGPLDECNRVIEVRLEVAPLGGRHALEAVEVEMRDLAAVRVVAVADRVRRARHAFAHTERDARAAYERRLTTAELARHGHDVADREPRREVGGQCLRFVGGARLRVHAETLESLSMPAYLIVETDITDPEQYEQYKAASPAAIAASGGRFLARGGELAVFEGDWNPKRLVLVEFPDLQTAKRFYESPEYQEAIKLREGAASLNMFAVDGL